MALDVPRGDPGERLTIRLDAQGQADLMTVRLRLMGIVSNQRDSGASAAVRVALRTLAAQIEAAGNSARHPQ